MEAPNYMTEDGWISDGHTVSPVMKEGYVTLEIFCPFPEWQYEPPCGGRKVCYVREGIDELGAEIIELEKGEEIRNFPLKVDYRWTGSQDETELWLRPSK